MQDDNEGEEKLFEFDKFSHLFETAKKVKIDEKITPAREIDIKYREKTANRIKYVEKK